MCTYKPDVNGSFIKVNHRYDPVIITFYIKYISVIADCINCIEGIPHTIKT